MAPGKDLGYELQELVSWMSKDVHPSFFSECGHLYLLVCFLQCYFKFNFPLSRLLINLYYLNCAVL